MDLNNQSSKIKKHIFLSTIYKPISMIISMLYVPIFLNCLGSEKYGIWVTISSILSWMTNFDIGIGNGLRNRLAEYYAKGDKQKSQNVVATSYVILSLISIVMFVIFMIISCLFDLPKFMGISSESEPISIILIIAASCVCLNFVLGLCSTIFYAIQEASVVALKGIVVQLMQLLVALFLTFISKSSLLWVAILYGLSEVIVNVVFSGWLFHRNMFLFPYVKNYDRKYVDSIISLGSKFFILQICSLLIYSCDNIIISKYIGASSVTAYSIVHNVFTLAVIFHGAINAPMWSAYTAANARNDLNWIKQSMFKVVLVTIIISIGTLLVVPIFKPLAFLWLGKKLHYAQGLIILEAIYTIFSLTSNCFSSLLSGVNAVDNIVKLSIFQAIINIPLSIFFVKVCGLGIVGVKIGSIISIGISAVLNPIWCFRWYTNRKENKGKFSDE